jgi:hypothetical protein
MAVEEAAPRYRRINHPSLDERLDQGRAAGDRTHPSSHAGGDSVAMAEYLAGDDAFDQSITDFCERYADQNEQDHAELAKAVRSGRLEAVEGV